jgi:HD superfamily phosphodiesterase
MCPEKSPLVNQTEKYVKDAMSHNDSTLMIAHDFKHVDRVRKWALTIAEGEGYPHLEMLEVTALLHDIGLSQVSGTKDIKDRAALPPHGPIGAEIAARFLKENSALSVEEFHLIVDAIKHHSDSPKAMSEYLNTLEEKGKLAAILTDADMLDALGAVGLMRAFTSKYFLPEYDPADIKGIAWGLSDKECMEKFGVYPGRELAPVNTIIDQINQQIRYYRGLHINTVKRLATPFVQFMKDFVLQLEHEISG